MGKDSSYKSYYFYDDSPVVVIFNTAYVFYYLNVQFMWVFSILDCQLFQYAINITYNKKKGFG